MVEICGIFGYDLIDCQVRILITKELPIVWHGQIIRFSVAFPIEKPTSLLLQ